VTSAIKDDRQITQQFLFNMKLFKGIYVNKRCKKARIFSVKYILEETLNILEIIKKIIRDIISYNCTTMLYYSTIRCL